MKKPKIALVFSGGGALGFAHIGAIEAFEENNINIDILYSSQCKHQIYMQLHPYIKIK